MKPIDQRAWHIDSTQDFMSTGNRVVRMNQIASIVGPWIINLWFLYVYRSDDKGNRGIHNMTSTESRDMLATQWHLQSIQFICFWTFTVTDWAGFSEQVKGPKLWKGVISYIALVITLVIVPLASVIHWSIAFDSEDSKNNIVTWLSIYPMMSLMNCLYLFNYTGISDDY